MTSKPRTTDERRPGVIIVITLLALFLIASLLCYVINIGQQTGHRVITQNAADAAAAAGAGWVARSFNTVAMNNVAMAQEIVNVQVLDGMPMAIRFTDKDEQTLLNGAYLNPPFPPVQGGVHEQLNHPVMDPGVYATRRGMDTSRVQAALQKIADELVAEIELLAPLDPPLDTDPPGRIVGLCFDQRYDVRVMTYINGPNGQGEMWKCMANMDLYSQTVMANLGVLAQLNADRGGEVNLPGTSGDGTSAAMMVPFLPNVPYQRGAFDDFLRPINNGLLPEAVDDKTTNRGPYDTVFYGRYDSFYGCDLGWYYLWGGRVDSTYIPGNSAVAAGGRGDLPFSGGTGYTGASFTYRVIEPPTNYTTYGPMAYTLSQVVSYNAAKLYHSRFGARVTDLANIKLGYLWPGQTQYTIGKPTPLRARGYQNGQLKWDISILKDYHYWYDGPNLLRTAPPSNMYYLEDGVNTTSDDLVLRIEDMGNGTSKVTYMSMNTGTWTYEVVGPDGKVLLSGLGRGVNGNRWGSYSATYPTPLVQMNDPEWITDYTRAMAIIDAITEAKKNMVSPPATIVETRFVEYWIKSKYSRDDPRFLSPGTWAPDPNPSGHDPFVIYSPGTVDPRTWTKAGGAPIDQISTDKRYPMWRDTWSYQVFFDSTIGIEPQYDEKGNPIPQPVYRVDDYMFGGINIGTGEDVQNPNNFTDRALLPAPLDFDHSKVTPNAADRRKYLTYLTLARRDDRALMWPGKFVGHKPYPNQVSLAQAHVFNNHSWDLWTQMWGAQLQPIANYDDWLTVMEASLADIPSTPSVSSTEADDGLKYLKSLKPLAPLMLQH